MHASSGLNLPMVCVSILATAICWGVYGPLLQWGHMAMGSGRLRPFICVGIAYLVVAVVGPILVVVLTGMEKGEGLQLGWSARRAWLLAATISTTLFALSHLGKPTLEATLSVAGGYLLCLAVGYLRTIWPAVWLHAVLSVSVDTFCLLGHHLQQTPRP